MLLIYIYVLFDNEYKKTYYDFNINNESLRATHLARISIMI